MARHWFGGGIADWAFTRLDGVDGNDGLAQLAPGAEITFWNLPEGGTQHTDLLVDGVPADLVVAESDAAGAGQIPRLQGPDGIGEMWADGGTGHRALMTTSDVFDLATQAIEEGGLEQLDEHAGEPNAHDTRLADLTDVNAPSPLIGQVLARAAGGVWEPANVDSISGVTSVDGNTGAVDLTATYLLRALLGLGVDQLTAPLIDVLYDHVPDTSATDLIQIRNTHQAEGVQITAWMNERGMWRLEQRIGSRFDNLFLAIMDGAANPATSGWPFRIELRTGGMRELIGGLDPRGRYETSLFAWTDITDIDPDATGDYAASAVVGPAPLQVRLETTDIVRMQGRLAAAGVTADDTLFNLPAGLLPLSSRLVGVPSTGGVVLPVELLASGNVVARATEAGTQELSFDDITYARVEADQDTGEWVLDTVATGSPSPTSPLEISFAGTAGRLYILVLSGPVSDREFTGVTDDGSNTWAEAASTHDGTGRAIALWYVLAADPFTTVSAAFSAGAGGNSFGTLVEVESGFSGGTLLDVADAVLRSSSAAPAPLEITPSGDDRLVIAAVMANPNTTEDITASLGWTGLASHVSGHALVFRTDAPGSVATGVSWTFGTPSGSGHVIAAFNPQT